MSDGSAAYGYISAFDLTIPRLIQSQRHDAMVERRKNRVFTSIPTISKYGFNTYIIESIDRVRAV